MYTPTDILETEAEVEAMLGPVFPSQINKIIDHIDPHCQTWIERSPYMALSTADALGNIDVSPRGDPPGFVKVLDAHTLAVPDRPGNNRGDTFRNLLQNPAIGLMFMVPQRREVVRVRGKAVICRDAELLETMAIKGRVPLLALVVRVEAAFFHCGKAAIRSGLWTPEAWADPSGLPSYAEALLDHGKPPLTLDELEARTRFNEGERLYDDPERAS
ncbi:MAG: MSMEG_1061 family FMN-dependent PPOX-type flavoprotein [Pseudomonadota bacterium]